MFGTSLEQRAADHLNNLRAQSSAHTLVRPRSARAALAGFLHALADRLAPPAVEARQVQVRLSRMPA